MNKIFAKDSNGNINLDYARKMIGLMYPEGLRRVTARMKEEDLLPDDELAIKEAVEKRKEYLVGIIEQELEYTAMDALGEHLDNLYILKYSQSINTLALYAILTHVRPTIIRWANNPEFTKGLEKLFKNLMGWDKQFETYIEKQKTENSTYLMRGLFTAYNDRYDGNCFAQNFIVWERQEHEKSYVSCRKRLSLYINNIHKRYEREYRKAHNGLLTDGKNTKEFKKIAYPDIIGSFIFAIVILEIYYQYIKYFFDKSNSLARNLSKLDWVEPESRLDCMRKLKSALAQIINAKVPTTYLADIYREAEKYVAEMGSMKMNENEASLEKQIYFFERKCLRDVLNNYFVNICIDTITGNQTSRERARQEIELFFAGKHHIWMMLMKELHLVIRTAKELFDLPEEINEENMMDANNSLLDAIEYFDETEGKLRLMKKIQVGIQKYYTPKFD